MTTSSPQIENAQRTRLKRIKLAGFRSIRELDLEFGDLTVLIGANGSGKSNLLGFLDMMRYIASERLQYYVATNGGASSILHYGPKRTPTIRAEFFVSGQNVVADLDFALTFASSDKLAITPDKLAITEEFVGLTRDGFTATHGTYHPIPMIEPPSPSDLEFGLMEIAYPPDLGSEPIPARSQAARLLLAASLQFIIHHFHDTTPQAAIRLTEDLNQNRFLVENGGNLAAFLYMLRHTKMQHFNQIVSTIRLAVPYFNNFILEPDRLNRDRIVLRWQDRRLEYEFGPHQLSDGSLRAIALITLLMQPKEMLPSVILLDEPELGLHPSAVGLIGSLIRAVSEDTQVIVATQSPRLLAEFQPEDIVVVEREEDKTGAGESTFKRLSRADLGDWLNEYDLGTLYEMNVTGGGPQ